MRILYLGNPYSRNAGARHFGFATRFYNGLIRNGHMSYYFADKEEARQKSPLGLLRSIGIQKTNKFLLKLIGNIQPEAIVFSHVGIITAETMQHVRQQYPDIRIAYLNVDALFSPRNIENIEFMRSYCDAIFMTTAGKALTQYSTDTCKFYFVPNVTDRSIDTGRAFDIEHPQYDVAAFMHGDDNLHLDQAKRLSLASRVAGEIDGIKTFYRGFDNQPRIYGFDYLKALGNSAMTLCLNRHSCDGMMSTSETRHIYSSDRTAHVMGNGSMAVLSNDFGLQHLYSDKEVVFFGSDDELLDKVRFYKNNTAARQAVAKAGWEKAHGAFDEITIMKYVMERLFNVPLSQNYEWPTA